MSMCKELTSLCPLHIQTELLYELEKTERVGLPVIITALLASEETKGPEDKQLKTKYIYCKADFPLSMAEPGRVTWG